MKAIAKSILRQVAGWVLIVAGVIGLFLPVIPQIPFLAAGAILLAPYVPFFHRLSLWIQKKFPRASKSLRKIHILKDYTGEAPAPAENRVDKKQDAEHSGTRT